MRTRAALWLTYAVQESAGCPWVYAHTYEPLFYGFLGRKFPLNSRATSYSCTYAHKQVRCRVRYNRAHSHIMTDVAFLPQVQVGLQFSSPTNGHQFSDDHFAFSALLWVQFPDAEWSKMCSVSVGCHQWSSGRDASDKHARSRGCEYSKSSYSFINTQVTG
jgi:hypothetical protein